MNITSEIQAIFEDTLSLGATDKAWTDETELLGALPELDSLAVTSVMFAMEERFGIFFTDDEVSVESFANVGTLRQLVESKLAQEAGS